MIAIEIRHNGELKATCGLDEFRQLTAMLHVSSAEIGEPGCEVECMGLRTHDETTDEVLRWVKKRISFGDEVSLKWSKQANLRNRLTAKCFPNMAAKKATPSIESGTPTAPTHLIRYAVDRVL